MELDRLPTYDALTRRNLQVGDGVCKLCSAAIEKVEHVFIGCFVAANVWHGISKWCRIPDIFAFSLSDLLDMHKNLGVSEKKKDAVHGIIIIACWSIWRARNKLVFSNCPVKIESILSEIKVLGFLWFSNRSKHKGIGWEDWCSFVNMGRDELNANRYRIGTGTENTVTVPTYEGKNQ
ncbi:putative reverse transcriptase zinc-binding domain-containing protein [Helianthus annuus]|nr:putative reverse transcriptase zinc-binding domain-containing protein [Helianthus annuus]